MNGRKNVKLKVPGTGVTLVLKGNGTGTAYQDGTSIDLQVTGTDAKSSVQVVGKGAEIGNIQVAGAVKQIAAASLPITRGLTAVGAIGKLDVASLTGGTIAAPSFGQVMVRGPMQGATLVAGAGGGSIGKLTVKGAMTDAAVGAGQLPSVNLGSVAASTVSAAAIGQFLVRGDVQNATVLAGANLGSDARRGGTESAADQYGDGSVGKFLVVGMVADSTVAAGIDLSDPMLDGRTGPLSFTGMIRVIQVRRDATGSSVFASKGYGPSIVLGRHKIKDPSENPHLRDV